MGRALLSELTLERGMRPGGDDIYSVVSAGAAGAREPPGGHFQLGQRVCREREGMGGERLEARISRAWSGVMGAWRWMEYRAGVLGQAGGMVKDLATEGPMGPVGSGEPVKGVALGSGRVKLACAEAPSGSLWRARDQRCRCCNSPAQIR